MTDGSASFAAGVTFEELMAAMFAARVPDPAVGGRDFVHAWRDERPRYRRKWMTRRARRWRSRPWPRVDAFTIEYGPA